MKVKCITAPDILCEITQRPSEILFTSRAKAMDGAVRGRYKKNRESYRSSQNHRNTFARHQVEGAARCEDRERWAHEEERTGEECVLRRRGSYHRDDSGNQKDG